VSDKRGPPAEENWFHWCDRTSDGQISLHVGISETSNLWRSSSAVTEVLCTPTKICTKLEERWIFHGRLFFDWKSTDDCHSI